MRKKVLHMPSFLLNLRIKNGFIGRRAAIKLLPTNLALQATNLVSAAKKHTDAERWA
jgi:hypothetical protein